MAILSKINLEIDRLELEGVSRADGRIVGAALERELARLITRDGLPPHVLAQAYLPRLDAGTLRLAPGGSPGTRPRALGRRLAHQVYGGLKR